MGVLLFLKRIGVAVAVVALVGALAPAAHAYTFTRPLKENDKGPDVKALKIRISGWYSAKGQDHLALTNVYDSKTAAAVASFQGSFGLEPDGIAGPATFAVIDGLEDDNGSTLHFKWKEFKQKRNSNCSAKANAYAGTFKGGMVAPRRVKKNVRWMMWRLEAIRHKAGGKPIGITSAYRSVTYNKCIGGAGLSQHMYGTAADNRMAEANNREERDIARASQIYGIGCYSSMAHNHFDLRLENKDAPSAQFWWWPKQDKSGRDLASDGKPCWGETATRVASTGDGSGRTTAAYVPTESLLERLVAEPEWYQGQAD